MYTSQRVRVPFCNRLSGANNKPCFSSMTTIAMNSAYYHHVIPIRGSGVSKTKPMRQEMTTHGSVSDVSQAMYIRKPLRIRNRTLPGQRRDRLNNSLAHSTNWIDHLEILSEPCQPTYDRIYASLSSWCCLILALC